MIWSSLIVGVPDCLDLLLDMISSYISTLLATAGYIYIYKEIDDQTGYGALYININIYTYIASWEGEILT